MVNHGATVEQAYRGLMAEKPGHEVDGTPLLSSGPRLGSLRRRSRRRRHRRHHRREAGHQRGALRTVQQRADALMKVPVGPTTKPTWSRLLKQATTPVSSTPQLTCRKLNRVFGGSDLTSPAAANSEARSVVENAGAPDRPAADQVDARRAPRAAGRCSRSRRPAIDHKVQIHARGPAKAYQLPPLTV